MPLLKVTQSKVEELVQAKYPNASFWGNYDECSSYCREKLNIVNFAPISFLGSAFLKDEEEWVGKHLTIDGDKAIAVVTDSTVRVWSLIGEFSLGGKRPKKQYQSQLGEVSWEDDTLDLSGNAEKAVAQLEKKPIVISGPMQDRMAEAGVSPEKNNQVG